MASNEPRREQTLEGRLLLWTTDWLTTLLLSAGMVFPCLSAYGVSEQHGFDLGAVLAFCVFGSLAAAAIFTWRHGYWAALAVLATGGLIFWRLWVHMTEDWHMGRPPMLEDLIDRSPGALFLLYTLVVLTIGWVVVRVRVWWLAAALVVLPVLPAIQAGVLPSWSAMLAGFIGWGSMLLTGLFNKRDQESLGRAKLLSLGGMASLVLILVMALPREGYLRPQWATDARRELILGMNRQLSRFFDLEELGDGLLTQLGLDLTIEDTTTRPGYGWGGSGLTEMSGTGMRQREDLSKVGPRRYAERLLMQVTTDQPNPAGRIYLRGTSFGIYTGTSWESGGGPEYKPERFPPLTAPNAPVYTMRVRDAGFSGTWYYPYRYAGQGAMDSDGRLTLAPEEETPALGAIPTETYSIPYCPGGPEDGFTPLSGSWAMEEAKYSNEELYRQYRDAMEQLQILSQAEDVDQDALADQVFAMAAAQGGELYGTYLDVPLELRETLVSLLPEINRETVTVDGRLPEQYQETVAAAARTAKWLASMASYDPDTPAMGDDAEDFVAHFLEQKRGFCVHFATAGAMLLRAQGIPTRYVNGYVAELDSRGWGTVMDSGAHAWIEIYLNGYGWYPVEMTPGYSGGVSGVGLEGAAGTPEGNDPEPEEDPEEDLPGEEETPDEETPEEDTPGAQTPEAEELPGEEAAEEGIAIPWKVLFGIAVVWAVFCAAYLLAQLARNRARKNGDTNWSVLNAYGRYKRLRRWGCGEDEELERLAKKAKFSQHILTEEERVSAWKCLDEDLKQSRIGQPVRRRWLLAVLYPIF